MWNISTLGSIITNEARGMRTFGAMLCVVLILGHFRQ